jgi:hypothetical protein
MSALCHKQTSATEMQTVTDATLRFMPIDRGIRGRRRFSLGARVVICTGTWGAQQSSDFEDCRRKGASSRSFAGRPRANWTTHSMPNWP